MDIEPKKFTVEQFQQALEALDARIGKNDYIVAFAPIRLISPGGFIAISYLRNRATTEDIGFIIDPQWARDEDIEPILLESALQVGEELGLGGAWINDDVSLFVSKEAKVKLFQNALEQDIVLWEGEHIKVLAAPLEWGLEAKLRRLDTRPCYSKAETDLADILVILKLLKDRQGRLDREEVRCMNTNGFDSIPSGGVLDLVAERYREKFEEDIFKD